MAGRPAGPTSACTRIACALLAAAVLGQAGCNSGPRLYPVTGIVVVKGKGPLKELAGYIVQFQSTTEPTELPGGVVGEDGAFALATRVGGKEVPGAREGTYRARLMQQPVEGAAPPPLLIPRRYTRFETANLQFDVKPGANDVTIELDR